MGETMRRIYSQDEKRIIELWFEGVSRDEIAKRVHKSGSTVSSVTASLPPCLQPLRDLSVELTKCKISAFEASKGAKLLSKLGEPGIDLAQVPRFIQTVNKLSERSDYEPKQIVTAAIQLSKLEEDSGKSYLEVKKEFETNLKENSELNRKNSALRNGIVQLERTRKRKLTQCKVTEKRLKDYTETKQYLRRYGITLTDPGALRAYLENMRQTGGKPANFAKFTRNFGSLSGRITYLTNQKQARAKELSAFKDEITANKRVLEHQKTEIRQMEEDKAKKENAIAKEIEDLRAKECERKSSLQTETKKLADVLGVKAETEEISKAIEALRKKRADLDDQVSREEKALKEIEGKITELTRQLQTLRDGKAKVEREIVERLKIKNYETELEEAITNLEQQKTGLDKELAEKKDKLALGDTVTDFFTRKTDYDFDKYCSFIDYVKKLRQEDGQKYAKLIAISMEKIRTETVEDLKQDWIFRELNETLWDWKEKLRKERGTLEGKVTTLEKNLAGKNDEVESLRTRVKLLEDVKVFVDGQPKTMAEIEEHVKSCLKQEIKKRGNEEFDRERARMQGLADWIYDKVTQQR